MKSEGQSLVKGDAELKFLESLFVARVWVIEGFVASVLVRVTSVLVVVALEVLRQERTQTRNQARVL